MAPTCPLRAQMATIDASNLAQAILSFIQDGDSMSMESQQFLSGMEVLKQQADLLREGEQRYRKVGANLYDTSDLVLLARRYESMARMMTSFAEILKSELSDGDALSASRTEYLIRRGSFLLAAAVREVKRAKEYLSPSSVLSEAERRQGIKESGEKVERLSRELSLSIRSSLKEMDSARVLSANLSAMDSALKTR